MNVEEILDGLIHEVPEDMSQVILNHKLIEIWNGLTPISRNEWICWINDAKKEETRLRRIDRLTNDLSIGKKRPCCWPGCSHR